MSTSTLPIGLTIISIIIALFSLIFAAIQTFATIKSEKVKKQIRRVNEELVKANEELRKANEMLKIADEEKCARRCRNVSDIAGNLAENMSTACQIIQDTCINKKQPCNTLSSKVDSSVGLTRQLIRFCEDLNEDQYKEFGHYVDIDLAKKLADKACLLPPENKKR